MFPVNVSVAHGSIIGPVRNFVSVRMRYMVSTELVLAEYNKSAQEENMELVLVSHMAAVLADRSADAAVLAEVVLAEALHALAVQMRAVAIQPASLQRCAGPASHVPHTVQFGKVLLAL